MAEEKIVSLPDQIQNEVTLLMNEMKDHDREIVYRNQKKNLAHAKLWDLIGNKLPETRGVQCSLNIKKKTVTINKKPKSIPDMLKGLMGGPNEDEDDD